MTDRARKLLDALIALSQATGDGDPVATTDLGFAVVDDGRRPRTGLPEVVFGSGKTAGQITALFRHFRERQTPALATRVAPDVAAVVRADHPEATYEPGPRLLWWHPAPADAFRATVPGRLVVCSGGTSDMPVAEEAARCAEWFGLAVTRMPDIGVAGLHRLAARLPELVTADAIVAVAGMEGALPSVLAGLVAAPVIAVPTSIGYGTHLGGWTPLLAMLNSCAAGVSVVNVDNGFGAAQVAWRILGRRR